MFWVDAEFKKLTYVFIIYKPGFFSADKYKGNKKRAARKFKEVKEAKEIISSAWDC